MDEEYIPVTIWMAGRSYRLRIRKDEESAVRKAVKLADNKINEMRTHYAGKDDQDFIAMTLLAYASNSAIESFNNPLVQDELNKLSKKIDKILPPEVPVEQQ